VDRIVLGVFDGPSGGAALVREGALLAIAEEDRLLRRHRVSGLPRASVQSVLARCGVGGETVSAVVIATRNATYSEGAGDSARPPLLYRVGTAVPSPAAVGRRIRDTFARDRRRRIDEALRSEFGMSCPITFLDHHRIHAVSAAALTGSRDALILTMDSGADGAWLQVASVRDGHPETRLQQSGEASLLGFLLYVCDALGLGERLDRFERLLELARRGDARLLDRLTPFVSYPDGRIDLHDILFRRNGIVPELLAESRREDLAASALRFAGESAGRFARRWLQESGHDTLVLGGDLFDLLPVVDTMRRIPELAGARVPMAPGDAGLPLGCAFAGSLPEVLAEPFPLPGTPLDSPFVGLSYPDDEIEEALLWEGIPFRHEPDPGPQLARALAEGRTVARFFGATEIGHRGLGNRALLRSPRGELRRGRVGFLVKSSAYHALVLESAFGDWLQDDDGDPARFRTAPGLAVPSDRLLEECPDLAGWDGRVAVQTVDAAATPDLHRIVSEFEAWTGIPILAAAPFRLPDEPLVSSPRDALRTFRVLGADLAALGPFLVANPDLTATAGAPPPARFADESPDEVRR
jgi:carbamoyltransferase